MTSSQSTDFIRMLRGPILVLGAAGFIGANLARMLLKERDDVLCVVRNLPAWRLVGIDRQQIVEVDLNDLAASRNLVNELKPATIFDCVAYGAYSFETDHRRIYETNVTRLVNLVEMLVTTGSLRAYVHAGSSSEYGTNSAGPDEAAPTVPNSHYAVSKVAAGQFISFAGKSRNVPIVNLRLYSIYGPFEDSTRLMPALVSNALAGGYPPLVNPETARDFVFIEDVCSSFIMAAAKMRVDIYGESFNIGSGQQTTIGELAQVSRQVFGLDREPVFGSMPSRGWDLNDWYANTKKAEQVLGWRATTNLSAGLQAMAAWLLANANVDTAVMTKKNSQPLKRSISAIVACYKDEQAIPIMHQQLTEVFRKINVDYEIIFVNDGSPDNCGAVIQDLSSHDHHVVGITHSRNFGSQMAFRSGMEMSVMQACVLLDGDLQDPPRLIEQFYAKWLEGYDVIYGVRTHRDMPMVWGLLYKLFYRVFAAFSYIKIPHDAGDFSLIDNRVIGWLLNCPERDLFMRGLRAYVGFKQTGVPYTRPKRLFGVTTNNMLKNLEWAKRGIFSFSNTPVKMLTALGTVLLIVSLILAVVLVGMRIVDPSIAPRGATTLLLGVLFFGALNLFGIGLVGEYVTKILEEVKLRPRLIRAALIRDGVVSELLPDGRAKT